MKPTKGRIVMYTLTHSERDSYRNNGSVECAAAIVAVHSDTLVNLRLLTDSDDAPPRVTSVSLGTGEGQWRWPERV